MRIIGRPEAFTRKCSVKRVFLKISQDSQKNACVRVSFLIKVAGLRPIILEEKTLTMHIWNPAIVKWWEQFIQAVFSHNHEYSGPCETFTYVKTWHIWNPGIFRTLNPSIIASRCIFRTLSCLQK